MVRSDSLPSRVHSGGAPRMPRHRLWPRTFCIPPPGSYYSYSYTQFDTTTQTATTLTFMYLHDNGNVHSHHIDCSFIFWWENLKYI